MISIKVSSYDEFSVSTVPATAYAEEKKDEVAGGKDVTIKLAYGKKGRNT